jgi:hypothetical protein
LFWFCVAALWLPSERRWPCILGEVHGVTLSCDGVDDGVGGVQLHGSIGDLHGEVGHGMVYDDIGIVWTLERVVYVLCWEAFSPLASACAC